MMRTCIGRSKNSHHVWGQNARPPIATEADFRGAMKELSNWVVGGERNVLKDRGVSFIGADRPNDVSPSGYLRAWGFISWRSWLWVSASSTTSMSREPSKRRDG